MKQIGVVICNYNKQDYIINCIKSVLESSIDNFDIYVVDNASTDESVKLIEETYGNQVNLIVNKDNLGGSGGFNTGLREALKHGYKYIMLMDNDIIADRFAIEELFNFLEKHDDVGMVGSKVYYMDEPEKIWGYGGIIDFNEYKQKDKYKNMIDGESIPEIDYCDYVAACSLMARTDAIEKVGIMPEDNFIYWDDMEWGYRFNQAGYKVAVYGKSKIWHKAGGRNATNTFIHYYMQRNRINFFMNVLDSTEKKQKFLETILAEHFRTIYSVNLKGETNIAKTLMNAIVDAANGVRGRATDGKTLSRPAVESRVNLALGDAKSVTIKFNGMYEGLGNIIKSIRKYNPKMEIVISAVNNVDEIATLSEQYKDCNVSELYNPEKTDKHLIMCDHIFKLTSDMPKDVYIDSWCNIVFTDEDFEYAKSYRQTSDLFVMCMSALFYI